MRIWKGRPKPWDGNHPAWNYYCAYRTVWGLDWVYLFRRVESYSIEENGWSDRGENLSFGFTWKFQLGRFSAEYEGEHNSFWIGPFFVYWYR